MIRSKFHFIIGAALWLIITPILCFICWEFGGEYGPLYQERPSTDVAGKSVPVSLSDDLTHSQLASYSFSVTAVPKPEGLPASGYLVLVASPKRDFVPSGSPQYGMLELKGVFEGAQEVIKPFDISSQMKGAEGQFIVFLDYQASRPDLVEFRSPQLCREK